MPLTQNNFMIKQFSQLQNQVDNEGQRHAHDFMNATHDSNLKASALKNNFVDEFQHPKLNFDQKSKSKKDAYQDEIH